MTSSRIAFKLLADVMIQSIRSIYGYPVVKLVNSVKSPPHNHPIKTVSILTVRMLSQFREDYMKNYKFPTSQAMVVMEYLLRNMRPGRAGSTKIVR